MFIRIDKDELTDEDIINVLKITGLDMNEEYLRSMKPEIFQVIRKEVEDNYIYDEVKVIQKRKTKS